MSILEPALAQKFIEKTAKHLEYNINIMNDKGIIIASKDASRVGNFHEVAFNMLNGTLETGVVCDDKKFLGTKPGVNMFIDYKNKHVGVICVTGNPDNVNAFAGLVKTSMEAMLEYELQMEKDRKRKNKAEQFLYYVLFDEYLDLVVADKMADELDLNKDIIRTCIIIKYDPGYSAGKIVESLMAADGHTYQDIITIARNDDIVMFKAVNSRLEEAVKDYRYIIEEYIASFNNNLPEGYDPSKFIFYVGTLQTGIKKYRESYIHSQELTYLTKMKNGIHYFTDHVLDYYRSIVTIKTYDDIFNVYDAMFNEDEKKQFAETVEALRRNNYNVVYSAKALYIHRNTLLARLNKLKEVLNIDPIANSADREFFNELAYYFGKK